ncbi:ATP-binding cassette domain-containing protein [candidate division KSB1 bacterium]|nr:ATP-binding cassette domain-containing protein [candidate division KSB1 bacterium]
MQGNAMVLPQNEFLEVDRITLAYGKQAVLQDLTLSLPAGEFIGLVGPNGAGKTTLLLGLSGQFKPLRGNIRFQQKDIYKENLLYKEKIGYVHERPFIYSFLSVEEYLYVVATLKHITASRIDDEINRVLDHVCLADERNKPGSDLSMGMQKKLVIASAMIGNPELVFLDEALNGIDIESAYRIKSVLRDYVSNGGTVVLSTHTLEVVEKICSRYVIMKKGALVADIDAGLFRRQQNVDLENYIMNLLGKK